MSHTIRLHQVLLIVVVLFMPVVAEAQETPSPESIEALKQATQLHPDSPKAFDDLCEAYFASGQRELAVSIGEKAIALAKRQKDRSLVNIEEHVTNLQFVLAALQAWSGQDAELAKTTQRAMDYAADSTNPDVLDRAGKMALLRPITDKARLATAVAMIRRAVELGKHHQYLRFFQMDLGMAEYRAGHYLAADQALRNAIQLGEPLSDVSCNSTFYWAMSQFKQGHEAEARALAKEGIFLMYPLPADPKDPLAGNVNIGNLVVWMAYKEAIAFLNIEGPTQSEFNQRRDAFEAANRLFRRADEEFASGHAREAMAHLASASVDVPQASYIAQTVAALQAWFGEDAQFASTVHRAIENAKGTHYATTAERAAKSAMLRPCNDKTQLRASLALARRAVELGKDNAYLPFFQMTLGMANYRAGDYAAADKALGAAVRDAGQNEYIAVTAPLYQAMSMFRQGKQAEARALFDQASKKMKPLPIDQNKLPRADLCDNLIMWMAYKEARTLLGLQAGTAAGH
ncbi:MAG TPA: hypothetical protein VFC78_12725 [Tepidisphaeraceae bacterium]|nr:hypothetical protein [Tepidisphaeraceae bacterium]